LEHIIAAKAIAFGEALTDDFMHYILQVKKNAAAMAAAFVKRGYHIISGGTDNHMMLIDLRNKIRIQDIAAGYLIVKESGGLLLDANLQPLDADLSYETRISFVAAANQEILDEIMSKINK